MHGVHPPPPQLQNREEYVPINQLNPHAHDKVNVKMIVIETAASFRMNNGDLLQTIRVGDPTGCVNLTIRHPDAIDVFQPSDILRLRNGFVNIHRGSLHLQANRASEILRIGEFCLAYTENPNMSEYKPEFAALERQKKGSPPEEGETPSGGGDPRRASGGARGGLAGSKRPGFQVAGGGTPPSKKAATADSRTRL